MILDSIFTSDTVSTNIVQDGQKLAQFLYALTFPNINRFSKLFHSQIQEKICNNTVTKDLNINTPQVCRQLPCEISSVLKATIENKTTPEVKHPTLSHKI